MDNTVQMVKAAAAAASIGISKPAIAEEWNFLFNPGQPREYPAATDLFQQGASVREVFIIDRGLVKLTCLSESGQELIVGLRSRGAILGAAPAIVKKPHSVTAVTLTTCHLYPIALDAFLRLAKTDAQFCWCLHQAHSREVYHQATQMVALKYVPARQRFEQLVWQLASEMGIDRRQIPIRMHLPLKYWEIAQLVGITPEHLSRVMKQLHQQGVILRDNGSLIISDLKRLYHPNNF